MGRDLTPRDQAYPRRQGPMRQRMERAVCDWVPVQSLDVSTIRALVDENISSRDDISSCDWV